MGDFDNDGFEDIYVTGLGATRCTTTTVTERSRMSRRAGVETGGWHERRFLTTIRTEISTCSSPGKWSRGHRFCGEHRPGGRSYCHPDNYRGVTNVLYHNNGDGTFTDVAEGRNRESRGKSLSGVRRFRWRWLDGYLRRQRFGAVLPVSQQSRRHYGCVVVGRSRVQ